MNTIDKRNKHYRWIVIKLHVIIFARILHERITIVEVVFSFIGESIRTEYSILQHESERILLTEESFGIIEISTITDKIVLPIVSHSTPVE
jgi:hypothetical protein